MKKHNEKLYNDPWERDFYETGSTRPPQDRGGTTALLLVLVILLGSACSALGIINLHLLKQIGQNEEQNHTLNVFDSIPGDSVPASLGQRGDSIAFPRMGLEGQTASEFDRQFYELPQGLLVTGVTDGHSADAAGIHAGDVITKLGSHLIASQEELEAVLTLCPSDQELLVEFYRHQTGQKMYTTITLSEE